MALGPHSYDPVLVCRPNDANGFRWSALVAERDGEQGAVEDSVLPAEAAEETEKAA